MPDDGLITIDELLRRINRQCETMSTYNPNRMLLQQCAVAITNLASRLPNDPHARTPGGLYVP